MKGFLALVIAASAGSVYGISDRAIYDIMYLPTAGTKYGITEFGFLDRNLKGSGSNGDVDINASGVRQELGYAISDRLSLSLAMSYLDAEIDQEGDRTIDQVGFTDPVVNGRFRLIDEDVKLDLIGRLLMSAADGEIHTDRNGNVKRLNNHQGGNTLTAGAQVGQQKENYQWAFLGEFRRNFERDFEINHQDVKYKHNNDFFFSAELLNKLAEKSYLRSHFSTEFDQRIDNKTSGYPDIQDPSTTYELGTQYQYLFSHHLLVKAGVDYAIENSNSGQFSSDHAWSYTVGANYQF